MFYLLKALLKKIYLLSFVAFETAVAIVSVALFSRVVDSKWKKSLSGIAVVLGNGPSLSADLDSLAEKIKEQSIDVWAVNNFCFSDSFMLIRPRAYVLADPNYWLENTSKEISDLRERFTDIINREVAWDMILMLPVAARRSRLVSELNSSNVSINYYNSTPVRGSKTVSRALCNVGAAMPAPLNVLIAALALAIGSNYRAVYVLGADHSWHEELVVTMEGEALVSQKHFYAEVVSAKPVYRPRMTKFTVGDLFLRWGAVFKSYEFLADYALAKKVKVVNLSSRSFIDAFDRSSLSRFGI